MFKLPKPIKTFHIGEIMKKDIHPQSKEVNIVCSSCNSVFKFTSTIKDDKFTIVVCGKCHPFYMGNSRGPSGLRKTIRAPNSLAHRTTWLRSDFSIYLI